MPFPCIQICVHQSKISNAVDTAARLYREATPEDRGVALEIWDTMTKAHDRLIKNIRTRNFEKYISIAHKDNGKDYFLEASPAVFVYFITFIFVLFLLYFVSCFLHDTLLLCRLTIIFLPFL